MEEAFQSMHTSFVSKNDNFKVLLSPGTENLKGLQN